MIRFKKRTRGEVTALERLVAEHTDRLTQVETYFV